MLDPNYIDFNISSSDLANAQMARNTFVKDQQSCVNEDSSMNQDFGLGYNEELLKMWFKREKNRLAATKCREKKREKLNHLLQKADNLEKLNEDLRQDCYRLEAEKRYLVKMLMERPPATSSSASVNMDENVLDGGVDNASYSSGYLDVQNSSSVL